MQRIGGINFIAFSEEADAEMHRHTLAGTLYARIDNHIREARRLMVEVGYYHPSMNSRKITGMILDAHSNDELQELVDDPAALVAIMVRACDTLYKFHFGKAYDEETQE
jgi:hypothetical protein